MNFKYNKKDIEEEKGFVILIAIVISTLLVSIGLFIAIVAFKEVQISSSGQASQRAFFAADSAIQCALYQEIRGLPFKEGTGQLPNAYVSEILCNNSIEGKINTAANTNKFLVGECSVNGSYWDCGGEQIVQKLVSGTVASYFFVSFADYTDATAQTTTAYKNAPYALVVIEKKDINGPSEEVKIRSFGHNKKEGVNIVERAIEVTM